MCHVKAYHKTMWYAFLATWQCYSWGGAMGHRPIQQKNGPLTTEIAIFNLERMAHWNFKFIANKWKMAHTMVCPAITLMWYDFFNPVVCFFIENFKFRTFNGQKWLKSWYKKKRKYVTLQSLGAQLHHTCGTEVYSLTCHTQSFGFLLCLLTYLFL